MLLTPIRFTILMIVGNETCIRSDGIDAKLFILGNIGTFSGQMTFPTQSYFEWSTILYAVNISKSENILSIVEITRKIFVSISLNVESMYTTPTYQNAQKTKGIQN